MPLRFRKRIKICDGVHLNLGLSGASVSVGTKGLRYTIGTSGRKTLSVGLPGTGLYYTKSFGTKKEGFINTAINTATVRKYQEYINEITSFHKEAGQAVDWNYLTTAPEPFLWDEGPLSLKLQAELEAYKPSFLEKMSGRAEAKIKEMEERLSNTRIEENGVLLDWDSVHVLAKRVLNQDVEAYLQAISSRQVLSAISEYGSEFELGTDNPIVMHVAFNANGKKVIPSEKLSVTSTGKLSKKKMTNTEHYALLQDYVSSCSIRIARELFALLPISYVVIHVEEYMLDTVTGLERENTILSVLLGRDSISGINFDRIDPSDFLQGRSLKINMNFLKTKGFKPVARIDSKS